jgi:hypothetical protein
MRLKEAHRVIRPPNDVDPVIDVHHLRRALQQCDCGLVSEVKDYSVCHNGSSNKIKQDGWQRGLAQYARPF